MSETSIPVQIRDTRGKGAARRLRAAEKIPAELYGHGKSNFSLQLDPVQLDRLLHASHAGMNTLIDLEGAPEVAGKVVLVKDMQRHPVRGTMVHVDFYEVNPDERIVVNVPIHLTGTAHGVTMGGLLDHSLRELELDCLPRAIPDEVVVDVSALDIGDSVHVNELALPDGTELRTDPELSVVSVTAPVAEEVEETEEGAEGEGAEAAAGDAKPDAGDSSDD